MASSSSATSHMKPCRGGVGGWGVRGVTGAELDLKLCVCFIRLRHWETHGVIAEPGNVAFIAGVEQNGSSRLPPVLVSNKVALLEGAILQEAKVVNL